MESKYLMIAIFVVGFGYLEAGVTTTCVADHKVEFDGLVNGLIAKLMPTLLNTSIPIQQQMTMVFQGVCKPPERTNVDKIQTLIGGCPALLNAPGPLGNLTFFNTTFVSLLINFESVDGFCACSPVLPIAWSLKEKASTLKTTIVGPITTVLNPKAMCELPVSMNMSGVFKRTYMLDQLIQFQNPLCTKLPKEAGFADKAQMIKVAGFISDMCPAAAELTDFDIQYMCVVTKLNTDGAKECFTKAESSTSDSDTPKCERSECVEVHAKECTEKGRKSYIYSVNLHQDKISKDDCASASGLQLSIVLLLAAALRCLL